uniref:GH84 domain-containing protein n=1 Tax=Esox lucius TaxID=8010 RepID=A0A3P8Y7F2_ESOLU
MHQVSLFSLSVSIFPCLFSLSPPFSIFPLSVRMQRWGLNTYLYGPKDDLKHRLLWREVYSPEEESQLSTLIVESEKRGVSELGCQAFAILFDDIDHSLCQADSQAYSSFAHAQVSVANDIYQFLGEPPVFLFCPTEYCGSLCSPSVSKSPYLMTVGEDLLPNISVIWTGNKVISRELSVEGLSEVESVLQRPPVVWDNLHANDYDSRRLFLGPFKGREPQLVTHLRGLLLNPNCEFEANYIPLHTLGTWFRTGRKERNGDRTREGKNESERKPHNDRFHQGPEQPEDLGEVPVEIANVKLLCSGKAPLSESQVQLLVGLHYLPHEHGPSAQRLLQDLTWLKANCHLTEEWRCRAARFLGVCEEIAVLHSTVVSGVNRAVLYDLYPYVWDLRNTALVAKAFICWLGCGTTTGADLLGVESEPWVFKGGVSGEVQVGCVFDWMTYSMTWHVTTVLY